MSKAFTGDLENLHIVDIIQLLHTTRKSGTFTVERPGKGKSRIVFSNGYIVSASHLDNRIYIGTVLLKMGLITRQQLDHALEEQRRAGKARKPLLTTLIEMGVIGKEDALKGLRKLIEITLVELIGWTEGAFTFEPEAVKVSEESSYMPGEMEEDINLDAQMVLMDALRVYDERERDRSEGKPVHSYEEVFADMEPAGPEEQSGETESPREEEAGDRQVITAEDLGLDSIDHLKKKLPRTLMDRESFDPGEIHRQQIREMLSEFSPAEQNRFISFLDRAQAFGNILQTGHDRKGTGGAIILHSTDPLLKHSVMTLYKREGVPVFSTSRFEEIEHYLSQSLLKSIVPLILLDTPGPSGDESSMENPEELLKKLKAEYPLVPVILLHSPPDYSATLQALRTGARTVIPRPPGKPRDENFIDDMINLLETLKIYLDNCMTEQRRMTMKDRVIRELDRLALRIKDIPDPKKVSEEVLGFLTEVFERAWLFIVKEGELVSERLFGERRVRIPLDIPSVFRDVVEKGSLFFGPPPEDGLMERYLYTLISPPERKTLLLLPLRSGKKTLALIYADFGSRAEELPIDMAIFDIISNQAALAMEAAFVRRRLAKGH